jgi:hypothetical protein
MTGTLAARRPHDTASMEFAPGIHNVITERAPAVGVTNTYLVVGSAGAIWVDTGWDREGEGRVSARGERFTCLDRS